MFDNPMSGSNPIESAVAKLHEQRKAEQPDPVESEATGGTEEAVEPQPAETQSEADNYELEAEQDGVEGDDVEESAEAPDYYTVKVNGEEKQVSLDELQSGYMMHSDYTKKTMALSEQSKELEANKAQFDQERMAKLQELESFIESQDEQIDWQNLKDTDPAEYLRLKELQDERKETAAKERAELEAKQLKQLEDYTNQQAAKLEELMGPAWTPEKKAKDFEQATDYLKSMGVSDDEINQLRDARFWLMAFDAMQYRSIQKNKDYVSHEVKKAPKSVKPGQSKVPPKQTELDKAKANLRNAAKGNDIDAAVALLQKKRGK